MYSANCAWALPHVGFPIQKSPGIVPVSGFPRLFAASHVFHRLLTPRHPPYALISLAVNPLTTRNLKATIDTTNYNAIDYLMTF